MICLLLPPSLLTPINLHRRRVFVSSLFSFFSVFLVCFPSNIFSFILSRVPSPFSPSPFFRSLCIPQIVTSLSFSTGLFSFSFFLSRSVHPMYRSSSFTPRSVFLSSALSLQPSICLLSFLSNSRHGNRFRPCLHFRLRLSRPLHLHVHPFWKHWLYRGGCRMIGDPRTAKNLRDSGSAFVRLLRSRKHFLESDRKRQIYKNIIHY